MSASSVVGYGAIAQGARLEPLTYPVPVLGEHDIRVAVSHCGLCFTDIAAIDDFYGITTFPFVPGHEIVGHVEARGSAVTSPHEGDRVGIGWQGRSCGRCAWCAKGEPQLCYDVGDMGTWERHGGFADSVTVDADFAYPLPVEMRADVAAALMCAGIAVYTPLRRYAEGLPHRVAIYGAGGLGHLAIQFAHALGYEVTVLSSSPAKEQEARAFGADRFIEVHVATSLDLCRERDTRGNYDRAHAPPSYEAPREPDVSVALDNMSVEDAAKVVVKAIEQRGLLDE